jgi:GT2 family glycosyltransferase
MRASVDAVLVVRRGGEQLEASLRGLLDQTRPADRICVVDLSADSTLRAQVDSVVGATALEYVVLPFGTSWAEGISDATEVLYPGGVIPEQAWLWLLRDDTAPGTATLEYLTLSVEGAPLVRIAGPKQRVADRPLMIREMGETMTRFGERIAMAERELDQAQYDRLSDVLAVGEAGMLVHAATLQALEGFDPALSPLDGGLDLCVRVRLAGHRVVVLPRAMVDVGSGLFLEKGMALPTICLCARVGTARTHCVGAALGDREESLAHGGETPRAQPFRGRGSFVGARKSFRCPSSPRGNRALEDHLVGCH